MGNIHGTDAVVVREEIAVLPVWAAFVLLVVVDLVPVAVFARRMARRARGAGVAADRHYVFAFLGGLAGGLAMQGITLEWLVSQMHQPEPVSYRLGMAALILNGLLGSAIVAGCVYLHFRARTAHDPDYDDAPKPHAPADRKQS